MKPDPVIERIRAVRREISKKCGHDPKRLVAHYRAMEKQFADRMLKRAATRAGTRSDQSKSKARSSGPTRAPKVA